MAGPDVGRRPALVHHGPPGRPDPEGIRAGWFRVLADEVHSAERLLEHAWDEHARTLSRHREGHAMINLRRKLAAVGRRPTDPDLAGPWLPAAGVGMTKPGTFPPRRLNARVGGPCRRGWPLGLPRWRSAIRRRSASGFLLRRSARLRAPTGRDRDAARPDRRPRRLPCASTNSGGRQQTTSDRTPGERYRLGAHCRRRRVSCPRRRSPGWSPGRRSNAPLRAARRRRGSRGRRSRSAERSRLDPRDDELGALGDAELRPHAGPAGRTPRRASQLHEVSTSCAPRSPWRRRTSSWHRLIRRAPGGDVDAGGRCSSRRIDGMGRTVDDLSADGRLVFAGGGHLDRHREGGAHAARARARRARLDSRRAHRGGRADDLAGDRGSCGGAGRRGAAARGRGPVLAPSGSMIMVGCGQRQGWAFIVVRDEGPGINER